MSARTTITVLQAIGTGVFLLVAGWMGWTSIRLFLGEPIDLPAEADRFEGVLTDTSTFAAPLRKPVAYGVVRVTAKDGQVWSAELGSSRQEIASDGGDSRVFDLGDPFTSWVGAETKSDWYATPAVFPEPTRDLITVPENTTGPFKVSVVGLAPQDRVLVTPSTAGRADRVFVGGTEVIERMRDQAKGRTNSLGLLFALGFLLSAGAAALMFRDVRARFIAS